ncbi:MAG: hypothetical protein IJX38_00460 [Clostridia bacterium]|nr:hypothetical protein [Clostridia bacterium]
MNETGSAEPKILIFTMTSWYSKVGANTWESLVSHYKSENLANIYLREEIPDSRICSRYFCISENRVIKSILKRRTKTGKAVTSCDVSGNEVNRDILEHNERYARMKKKRRYSMLLAREVCWKLGKWKTEELDSFLDEFKPDIILHGMDGYIHMNRIVRYAIKRTGAKAIGYIWDDNFTYKQSKKIGYKVYRYFQRRSLKKLVKDTQEFFAITPKTKKEADSYFGINCTVLSKPLNANPIASAYDDVQKPLRMLYTGNLLIGRDKSLEKISLVLREINKDSPEISLDVYTQTILSDEYLQKVQHDFCRIHPPIPQNEVIDKQKETDVLLFVEDLSENNLTARLSFSTKITDYFSTGKCIFAMGNEDLAPMQYFKETDSAITAETEGQIFDCLKRLLHTNILKQYAERAARCGIANHSKENIRKTFDGVIEQVHKGD